MKCIYPGPGVAEAERDRPTIHPNAGLLVPGEVELDPAVAEPLLKSGLIALPPAPGRHARGGAAPPSRPAED